MSTSENCTVFGVDGEKPEGSFYFKNASDGTGYKNAGKGTVDIVWAPKDAKGDYKQTTFTVSYTVQRAKLTIRPVAATAVYGEKDFKKAFSSFFEGLVANDNNDEIKAQLEAVLSYTILKDGKVIRNTDFELSKGFGNVENFILGDSRLEGILDEFKILDGTQDSNSLRLIYELERADQIPWTEVDD